jgi:succinate dehydrogenase/fumarate reductase-like Fe-S protein
VKIRLTDREGNVVKTFETEWCQGESILNLLERLRETTDPDLAFYGACGTGKCGACGISVDGKVALTCTTIVSDEEIMLAPLPTGRLIRDLLVTRDNG